MSNLKERLKSFLMNQTTDLEFVISTQDVAEIGPEETRDVNEMLERVRLGLDGSDGFRVDPARDLGETIKITKDPKMQGSIYSGAPDARLSDKELAVDSDNPFRPRYRKLAQGELDHHDLIKHRAMELLEAFRYIPNIRTTAGNASSGEGHANIKLAQRHLEDAVYRAVKALTA